MLPRGSFTFTVDPFSEDSKNTVLSWASSLFPPMYFDVVYFNENVLIELQGGYATCVLEGCTLFNVKIARFMVRKLYFSQDYIQPIFIKQSTSHIRIWALFKKKYSVFIFCRQYLQAFEANVIFATDMLEVFTLTFASNVYRYCTQDFYKLFVYKKCSYWHMRCTLIYENWLDITWDWKGNFLTLNRVFKNVCTLSKNTWHSHLELGSRYANRTIPCMYLNYVGNWDGC